MRLGAAGASGCYRMTMEEQEHVRYLQRRVLLREVQGEASGRGQGRRDQRPPDGEGAVPGVRHEPQPDPRQGLTRPASRTTPPGGDPHADRPLRLLPRTRPRAQGNLWTTPPG